MYEVSLVIPVYNVAGYIHKSLLSALIQSFKSIEYILVDDCCTDDSMVIVKSLLSTHRRAKDVFIYKHECNKGLSAARNTGLKNAHGEYVFFMDSDDEIVSDCIEQHYNALKGSDADFTIANIRLDGAKSIHIKPISDETRNLSLRKSYFRRLWSISACNKLYKMCFLKDGKLSFRENLLHEDLLWSYEVVSKAKNAVFLSEATYIYKIHQGSITTSKNGRYKIDSLLYILNWIKESGCSEGSLCQDLDFIRFFDFERFNTALLLLNYSGTRQEQQGYYRQLEEMCIGTHTNVYSILLNMPFFMFLLLMKPTYYFYKIVSKKIK